MERMLTKRNAVVFLCKELHTETANFANSVYKETDFEVFVVVDNEQQIEQQYEFAVIQINDKVCIDNGYVGCNIPKSTHINKEVIAWDKFLYTFCELMDSFDFVWVFEDDVFIPSVATINNLHNKYCTASLVTPNNFRKSDKIMDWHWRHIFDKIEEPYFYSMICAIGISRKVLNKIKEYVHKNNKLFYQEAMFNTIAMQDRDMLVLDPVELKSIVWMGNWGIDEFLLLPNNVFHPMKDLSSYPFYRQMINEANEVQYKPENNLPDFIKKYYV